MEPVTLARHAMATRFEIVLHGHNPVALRAAAEEALDTIERLENVLSLYRPVSEIAEINARASREPVRVSVPVFRLLEHALRLCEESGGAFDITVGPLMRCWGFVNDAGRVPAGADLEAARARVGWQSVDLDAGNRTVRFAKEGMMLDLGAIGKGYAIDQAAELLREAGVTSGILHGGTSSIHAIGHPPEADAWKVAIRHPADALPESGGPEMPVVDLRDEALSVSAVWGRSFQTDDRRFGHVIDPRTGQPAGDAVLAAVALPSTTESDALSTALLTLGTGGAETIHRLRPGSRCLVARPEPGGGLTMRTAGRFP